MVKILGYENRGNFESVFDGDNLGCDRLNRCQPDHCLRADPPDLCHYAFRVQRRLTYYIDPAIYGKMYLMGLAAYAVIAVLQFRHIQKIPMDEALKM